MTEFLIAGAVAMAAGVGQVLLSSVLFSAAFSQRAAVMLAALLGKITVYGGLFCLLFTVLRPGLTGAAVGFALGFFPGLAVWYVLKGRKQIKGEDANADAAADR